MIFLRTFANFIMKFSLKTYIYLGLIIFTLYVSYKVYDAFQSKKKYTETKIDLDISKNQIVESQKLFLDFRAKVNTLNFRIRVDSLTIIDKDKQIVFRDSLLITKDKQIIEIQKLIKPIENGRKIYKDSLDNLKNDYRKLLKRINRKGLFN